MNILETLAENVNTNNYFMTLLGVDLQFKCKDGFLYIITQEQIYRFDGMKNSNDSYYVECNDIIKQLSEEMVKKKLELDKEALNNSSLS